MAVVHNFAREIEQETRIELHREIDRLRAPFRAVDSQDWDYLYSLIPDGGRGRFWKEAFGEMRKAIDR